MVPFNVKPTAPGVLGPVRFIGARSNVHQAIVALLGLLLLTTSVWPHTILPSRGSGGLHSLKKSRSPPSRIHSFSLVCTTLVVFGWLSHTARPKTAALFFQGYISQSTFELEPKKLLTGLENASLGVSSETEARRWHVGIVAKR